jgi:hypothetical protein
MHNTQIEKIAKATTHHLQQHYWITHPHNWPNNIDIQYNEPAWYNSTPALPNMAHRTTITLLQNPNQGTTILTLLHHQHWTTHWQKHYHRPKPNFKATYSNPNYLQQITDHTDKTITQYHKNNPHTTPSPPPKNQ